MQRARKTIDNRDDGVVTFFLTHLFLIALTLRTMVIFHIHSKNEIKISGMEVELKLNPDVTNESVLQVKFLIK